MRSPIHTLAMSSLVLLSAASELQAAAAYRKLSGAEIRTKVSGMEITDQAHFSEQYMRDGAVRIVTMGRRIVGKWLVKQGQLCIETPKPEDARCAEIWVQGPKVQLRVVDDRIPYDVVIQKQQDRGWK